MKSLLATVQRIDYQINLKSVFVGKDKMHLSGNLVWYGLISYSWILLQTSKMIQGIIYHTPSIRYFFAVTKPMQLRLVCLEGETIKHMMRQVGDEKLNLPYAGKRRVTHWGRDSIAVISQTTFLNAFSWIKMHELRARFHLSLFLRLEITIFQHWLR